MAPRIRLQSRVPLQSDGTYNFIVAWGDGTADVITAWDQPQVTHCYASSGVYHVQIEGIIIGWQFYEDGDCNKLMGISQWGCLQFGNDGNYFDGCDNLVLTTTDAPNLSGITSLASCFANCYNLNDTGNLGSWDVSHITGTSGMFYEDWMFDQDLTRGTCQP